MPVYKLEGPDGKVYTIEGPEGATAEQLGAFITQQGADRQSRIAAQQKADRELYDPTKGMSTFDKVMAGAGKAVVDTGRGLGQMVGLVSRDDVAKARALDAPLMNTGAGMAGNIGGNVAMALLPGATVAGTGKVLSKAPAAAELGQALLTGGKALMAPTTIPGAAGVGALQGAIQPSTSTTETLQNIGLGAGAGAAVPTLVRGAQVAKAALDPFSQAGQNRIIGRAMNAAAGNEAPQALQNLRNAAELVPGSAPTAGQAAANPGIAALERTATATDPVAMNEMARRVALQNEARQAALQGVAPDRAAAVSARDAATNALYGQADSATIAITPELQALMQRPSMRDAQARAYQAALERGMAPAGGSTAAAGSGSPRFAAQTPSPMNPAGIALGREMPSPMNPSGIVGVAPEPVQAAIPAVGAAPRQTLVRGGQAPTPMNPSGIAPTISGRDAHLIKMSLDDMVNASPMTGIGGNELRAIQGTRGEFLDQIGQQVPAYTQARQTYAQLSRPVNQADIAEEIAKRATNFRGDITPAAYARALRDETAQKVTGQANATMAGAMEPGQMATLNAIKDDLLRADFAQTAGKGVGSDTVQKLAYSNLLNQSGLPSMVTAFPRSIGVGGVLQRLGDVGYKSANEEMKAKLAQALLNPQSAADLMEAGVVTPQMQMLIEGLRRGGAAVGASAPYMLNATKE